MGSIDLGYKNRVRFTLSHKIKKSLIITEPIGWNDDDKEYTRNKKYHGIFTKFSNSLEFIEDGADFINEVRDSYNINAEITLLKEERHPQTDRWTYRYSGVLDLSTWEFQDFKVKVKFNSNGLETEIKARESEKIEIERTTDLKGNEIAALETHNLELDGRKIFLVSSLRAENEETQSKSAHKGLGGKTIRKYIPFPLDVVAKSHTNIQGTDYYAKDEGEHDTLNNSMFFVADLDKNRKLDINYDLSFIVKKMTVDHPIDNAVLQLRIIVTENGNDYDIKSTEVIQNLNLDQLYTLNFSRTYDLLAGESISLQFYTSGRLGAIFNWGIWNFFYKKCSANISVEENSFFEKTNTKVVEAFYLGNRLVELLTGRKNAFKSEYLEAANKGYSHGHWIRSFDKYPLLDDNKYKPFTTSFKDFINDLDVTENLGLAIEKVGFKEQIVIRPKDEFYRNIVLIKLPYQVAKVKRKVLSKGYFSSIEIGYAKGWDNEEAMGLDEYNTQSTFMTPIVRVKNVLKKVSKYIYASYAGEFIRRKQKADYSTDDHRNDKEIFGFAMKATFNGYELSKWADDLEVEPTGVYDPESAYNLNYSPINLLIKHGRTIASSLRSLKDDFIRFSSSEGNSNLTTQLIGKMARKENEDIAISQLPQARFLPEEITFNHQVSYEIQEMLEGETEILGKKVKNIYGVIQFINEKGEFEHGYFEKLKPQKEGTWTLIKANR